MSNLTLSLAFSEKEAPCVTYDVSDQELREREEREVELRREGKDGAEVYEPGSLSLVFPTSSFMASLVEETQRRG